jgi:hypothetical protein
VRDAVLKLRFIRQAKLAEVGEAGQAKLEAARVSCRMHGFAAAVERTYLERSGVGVPNEPPDEGGEVGAPTAEPAWLGELDPSAREVAAGAWSALAAVRSILEVR